MPPLMTAGADRALRRATELAWTLAASTVGPAHLLWGLLQDESRAAEILWQHGIGTDQLQTLLEDSAPLSAGNFPQAEGTANLPPPDSATTGAPVLPWDDLVQDVLIEARRQATLLGRHVELGSEHLLAGLVTVDSPVQALLALHGLHAATADAHVARQAGTSAEPLSTDIRIQLPAERSSDLTDAYRILDASANRAREGLRVLEDYVRFSLDDRHLTAQLKHWRHDFSQALRLLPTHELLLARETQHDVGTTVRTRHEQTRGALQDVVTAGFKRVQEALRSLEEYGKLVSPELGERLGQLRYPLYTLERAVWQTEASRNRLAECDLYLLLSEELCPHGSGPALRGALAGGVRIVQVREKNLPDRALLEHARRVRRWTREAGALFIMNDRADLALLSEADGVHVGQEELTVREARRVMGPGKIVGVSTHTIEQARQAVLDGADYIGVGPVFPTKTKSFSEFAGLEFVRQVAAEITLPAFAIGGITPQNIAAVVAAGARRIAVSGALCTTSQPEFIAREFRSALVGSTLDPTAPPTTNEAKNPPVPE